MTLTEEPFIQVPSDLRAPYALLDESYELPFQQGVKTGTTDADVRPCLQVHFSESMR